MELTSATEDRVQFSLLADNAVTPRSSFRGRHRVDDEKEMNVELTSATEDRGRCVQGFWTRPRSKLVRLVAASGVALALLGISVPAIASELKTRFDLVSLGITRDAALALMKTPPDSTRETSTLWVPSALLRWRDGFLGPTYTIWLVGDRVVQKQACDASSC